ncbi:Allantoate amidinohydrolase [Camponotus japonicus]
MQGSSGNSKKPKINTTELCEVSSQTVISFYNNGALILFASDDFFGVAENLLQESEPINDKLSITLDAWVTRRFREQISQFVIIQLAARTFVHFICVDTTSLVGNVALQFSVQAINLCSRELHIQSRSSEVTPLSVGRRATRDEWLQINELNSENWPYLISRQPLDPGYSSKNKKFFMISSLGRDCTHLRLNVHPDGGISRLRVYGEVLPNPVIKSSQNPLIDLVSQIYGGNCIAYSSSYDNTHPNNLIKPSESIDIKDGWQTARSFIRSTAGFSDNADISDFNKIVGEEWVIFQLGYSGTIISIVLDTTWCEGDSPYVVRVQGLEEGIEINDVTDINNKPWQNIIPYTLVTESHCQTIPSQNNNLKMAYVKLLIKPDGCISRFRVFGYKS